MTEEINYQRWFEDLEIEFHQERLRLNVKEQLASYSAWTWETKILIIKKKQKGEDLSKIKALKQQIKELREENTRLQQKETGILTYRYANEAVFWEINLNKSQQ